MWFKVCDSLAQHRKALEAGPEALGLWVMAGAWSCSQLTDGFIPDYALTRLVPNAEALASRLLHVGLWIRVDGGYQFHEWSERQPSAEDEVQRQEQRREAGRKGGVTSGESRRTKRNEATASADALAPTQAEAQANTQAKTNPVPVPEGVPKGTPPCSPRSGASQRRVEHERFPEFYDAFPRHKGRKDAARKFERAIKSGVAPETLIAAARQYRAEVAGKDPKYVKHPATWLHRGCWDDEPDPDPAPQPTMSTADQRIAQLQAMKQSLPRDEPAEGGFLRSLPGGRSA